MASTVADQDSFKAARSLCRRRAAGLFYASAVLPRAKRDGVCALHAFLQMLTTAGAGVDGGADGGTGCCSGDEQELIRNLLDDLYRNHIELPLPKFRSENQHILYAAMRTIQRYQVPKRCILDVLEAQREHARAMRYATWPRLQRHCVQTGGSIGIMFSCVLGLMHSEAGRYAESFGGAVRLLEIVRNVRGDVERGRIYLPQDDLLQSGCTERDLQQDASGNRCRALIDLEHQRARSMLMEAAQGLPWLAGDGSRLFAALVIASQLQLTQRASRPKLPRLLLAAWRLLRHPEPSNVSRASRPCVEHSMR